MSVNHVNQPEITFQDGDNGEPTPLRYAAMAGGKMRTRTPVDINVHALYARQGGSDLIGGALALRYVFYDEGLWFGEEKATVLGGLNLLMEQQLSIFAGFQLNRSLTFAFSYDLLLNKRFQSSNANGGMQVLMRYNIGGKGYDAPALPFPVF